jgi:hypothetical protein
MGCESAEISIYSNVVYDIVHVICWLIMSAVEKRSAASSPILIFIFLLHFVVLSLVVGVLKKSFLTPLGRHINLAQNKIEKAKRSEKFFSSRKRSDQKSEAKRTKRTFFSKLIKAKRSQNKAKRREKK